jgi:hypothetical protein
MGIKEENEHATWNVRHMASTQPILPLFLLQGWFYKITDLGRELTFTDIWDVFR